LEGEVGSRDPLGRVISEGEQVDHEPSTIGQDRRLIVAGGAGIRRVERDRLTTREKRE
jgi:hypothetical protein